MRNTQSDSQIRRADELWQKNLSAVGLKLALKVAQRPENLELARSGRFMMWPAAPAQRSHCPEALQRLYGPAAGGADRTLPQRCFDKVYSTCSTR